MDEEHFLLLIIPDDPLSSQLMRALKLGAEEAKRLRCEVGFSKMFSVSVFTGCLCWACEYNHLISYNIYICMSLM